MKRKDYEKLLEEFKGLKGKQLKEFCEDKGINYTNTRQAFNRIEKDLGYSRIVLKCKTNDHPEILEMLNLIVEKFPETIIE